MIFVQLCTPFVKLGDYFPFVQSRRLLAQQNEQLRHDNDLLRQQVRALGETGRENLRLRQLLDLKEHTAFRTVTARVIGRDASNWWKSLQIDRGSNDGLRRQHGRAQRRRPHRQNHLRHPRRSARPPAHRPELQSRRASCRTRASPASSSGVDAAFTFSPRCLMTYVNRDAKVTPGESVITSGLGGVFPKGILIGTVTRAQTQSSKPACIRTWKSHPPWISAALEEVIVILGQE